MSTSSAFLVLGALGALLAAPHAAAAQTLSPGNTWELRFPSGGLVPTGAQREALTDAKLSAAQLSWAVRPTVAITGTFGWARSRDLSATNTTRLHVFTYDVGVEARPAQWFTGRTVTFTPLVGIGAGARSYNSRAMGVDATHNLAAYVSLGGEVAIGRVGLRLEARDYASGFKPLVGSGASDTRNDVVIMAGLKLHRRSASK